MLNKMIPVFLMLFAGSALAADISKTYDLEPFTGIETEGDYEIELMAGTTQKVMASSNEKTLKRLKMKVSNGILNIDMKSSDTWFSDDNDDIKITINVKELNQLDISGSVDLKATGISGKELKIDISGSSDMNLAGTVDNLIFDIAGSADIEAGKLVAKNIKVEVAGSADLEVNAIDSLDSKISGSGEISYVGSPTKVNTRVAGSGTIKKKG